MFSEGKMQKLFKQATHCVVEELMRTESHEVALTHTVIRELDFIFWSGTLELQRQH